MLTPTLVLALLIPTLAPETLDEARALLEGGDAQAAIAALDGVPAGYEADLLRGRAYRAWADELALEGRSPEDIEFATLEARSYFERAVAAAPAEDGRARVDLAYVDLYRLGDPASAYDLATEGLSAQPDDAELLLARGCAGVHRYWNAKASGDEDGAGSAWTQAVDDLMAADELLPRERVEPMAQLQWLYEDRGIPSKAVDCAIAIVDRDHEASLDELYRLAKLYAGQRRYDAAGKALQKMVAVSGRDLTLRILKEDAPTDVATMLHWSVTTFINRNDNATARSILEAITRAKPEDPTIWNNYAVACQSTARYEEAVRAYDESIELDPTDPRTYNDKAAILHHDLRRDMDEVKELYRKCIDMADEQLALADLSEERRAHLSEARRVAQDNLDGLEPQPGVLDRVLEGLQNLPPLPGEGGTDEGGADDGAGAEG